VFPKVQVFHHGIHKYVVQIHLSVMSFLRFTTEQKVDPCQNEKKKREYFHGHSTAMQEKKRVIFRNPIPSMQCWITGSNEKPHRRP
jgi:hypothetical protein